MTDTVFTRIMAGEIPADIVYEDEHCIAIRDINPQAPVHVLLIPRKVIPTLADAQRGDQELLGHLMLAAGEVARELGVSDAFRLIINNGEAVGMTISHLHLHLLAGKRLAEGRMVG